MPGPRSNALNGAYGDVLDDLQEVVGATSSTTDSGRGRAVLLAMLKSLDGIATPADTVNCSFNFTRGVTGQIDCTAVVTLYPAPPAAAAVTTQATGQAAPAS